MVPSTEKYLIWEKIELSESNLVCCMFEEAASLASSVIMHLCKTKDTETQEDNELNDMLESAGMVLVQSLKELGRTLEILKELILLFGSVTAIPVQVFLTGVCFQIEEGPSSDARESLQEFLGKWSYFDGKYFLAREEETVVCLDGCKSRLFLRVDEYLDVVEIYVVTVLGTITKDIDLAISWVEKAALPEEKRQEILRKLFSMYPKATSSSQSLLKDEHGTQIFDGSPKVLEAQYSSSGESNMRKEIVRFSEQKVPSFWLFRTMTLKFGSAQLVISTGNILLSSLMFLVSLVAWRKHASIKRILKKQVVSIKKALGDLWLLAFSYQVNPLAVVQPLPSATHGSQ